MQLVAKATTSGVKAIASGRDKRTIRAFIPIRTAATINGRAKYNIWRIGPIPRLRTSTFASTKGVPTVIHNERNGILVKGNVVVDSESA
jgi:hypothetical protein